MGVAASLKYIKDNFFCRVASHMSLDGFGLYHFQIFVPFYTAVIT